MCFEASPLAECNCQNGGDGISWETVENWYCGGIYETAEFRRAHFLFRQEEENNHKWRPSFMTYESATKVSSVCFRL